MKKKLILILLSSLLIFSIYKVNAAEDFTYNNANWSWHFCNWNGQSTSNCKWGSSTPIGTNSERPDNFYINGFRINLNYSNTTLVAGNSYTLNFNLAVSDPYYFASLNSPLANLNLKLSCIGIDANNCEYDNFTSFNVKTTYSGTGNVVKFTINFVPSQNSKYVKIYIIQTNNTYNALRPYNVDLIKETIYGRVGTINGTYVSGTGALIENQTNVIENQTNTIINQNTQINDNITNINDSINDSSIDNSSINDTFNNLMNDYVDSSNIGSFSGFLTLPLTWIQTFLGSSTCSDIQISLPYLENKFIILPCLDSFWAKLGSLSTLVELVWLAVVGTRIFNGLFTIVVDVKDPNNNQDMELLKSWEL